MIKILVSQNLVEVETFKDLLDQAGVACTIKNRQGSSLAGEVPFAEVFPELWIINDDDFNLAKELLENWEKAQPQGATAWKCSHCGEEHSPEFTSCWKCGNDRNAKST